MTSKQKEKLGIALFFLGVVGAIALIIAADPEISFFLALGGALVAGLGLGLAGRARSELTICLGCGKSKAEKKGFALVYENDEGVCRDCLNQYLPLALQVGVVFAVAMRRRRISERSTEVKDHSGGSVRRGHLHPGCTGVDIRNLLVKR